MCRCVGSCVKVGLGVRVLLGWGQVVNDFLPSRRCVTIVESNGQHVHVGWCGGGTTCVGVGPE
jgi:hypothetical protein